MKAKEFVHAIGWSIAITGLTLAIFEAGRTTWKRWVEWGARTQLNEIATTFDGQTSAASTQPQSLPPDYPVFVLCYHDFRETPIKWSISPQRLEAHLQTLKALGFTFLTVSELVDLLSGKWERPLPKRVVAVTVDDGFRSAYEVLFPLLKRYNVKVTLFVYTSWIGKGKGALTWEQLREMVESGLVEIASHTVTHPYPKRLKRSLSHEQYRDRMRWEFEQSKRELEQKLGIKVKGIAYPGGQIDGTMKALAQQTGYLWAVTVNPKPVTVGFDRYAIPRYGVNSATTVAVLKAWVLKQPIRMARFRAKTAKAVKAITLNANSVNPYSHVRNDKR